jgi:hypothetical protein
MKSSICWFRSILLIVLILPVNKVFSQSKFELSGGLGVPEYNNLKLRYGKNLQVGACVHFWYDKGGGIFSEYYSWSFSAEILYHFAGKSKYAEKPTWYLLVGLGYYHIDLLIDLPHEEYDIGVYPRIGRNIYFSKKMGINFDVGLFLPLSAQEGYEPYDFRLLPSGSISFFMRL